MKAKLVGIALSVLILAIIAGSASAKTPSVAVPDPGIVETDVVEKTLSLEVAQPVQAEITGRRPSVAMGIFPVDFDPDRRSALWQAFPQPPQIESAERTPSLAMDIMPFDSTAKRPSLAMDIMPFDSTAKRPSLAMDIMPFDSTAKRPSLAMDIMPFDSTAKAPSVAVPEPLQVEHIAKAPSVAVPEPLQIEHMAKAPSEAVPEPLQIEHMAKAPSEAVPEPLQIECNGPTMSFDLKKATLVEVEIYSVNGRFVRRISQMLSSDESTLTWDGRDNGGARAASGVYFARVRAEKDTGKGKLVLVR
ncbi:MAG: T9SS type A sorting domain-containing protein [Candidatus Eisenbacteria bacterium]|nr:T9SS type A sorting domain-containing protein [Candidatus Eisenbacteria bacterium]